MNCTFKQFRSQNSPETESASFSMTNYPAPHLRQESRPADSPSPSDPLLRDGSFIDANVREVSGSAKRWKASNSTEPPATPSRGPENLVPPGDSKSKGRAVEPAESWLPPGWIVETRVRTSGATAGSTDKYYYHSASGRRFRSRKEVLNFLETGQVGSKKKKGTDNAGIIKDSPESSTGKKRKKAAVSKAKTFNFDFSKVPEKISWVLTDIHTDSWTPFTGDNKVAESVEQEWAAAFAYLIVDNAARPLP